VPYWDVVNEAVEQTDGVWGFRSTIWHDRIGPDFIDLAFQRAAAYDPSAKFLYNDYNIAVMGNPKADYVFQMISDMKARGIPVTTIGMQNHWYITADGGSSGLPDVAMIRANMDRYAGIGVDVQFTEVDIRIGLPMTPEKDALQAQVYRDLLQACVDAPNCSHFTVWGLSDIDSWVPSTFPDMDFAHIFDAGFVAKTSYHAFTQVLAAYPTDAMGGVMAGGAGDPGQTPAAQAESGGCAMGRSLGSPSAPWSLLALFGFLFALRARSPRPVALRRASH
jgi:endo-1,4-beta-xylanase